MAEEVSQQRASAPHVIRADTVEVLSEVIAGRLTQLGDALGHIELANDFGTTLTATVERFNTFAEQGVDEEFNRGVFPIELAFHEPPREGHDLPNPTMYPLAETGPYYAILVGGGTLDTNGGPKVNAQAQVLSVRDEPIPGLYGAGNCVMSPLEPPAHSYPDEAGVADLGVNEPVVPADLDSDDDPSQRSNPTGLFAGETVADRREEDAIRQVLEVEFPTTRGHWKAGGQMPSGDDDSERHEAGMP